MSKYGFVYLWFDRKHKRYYVGCHWGTEDDGYICSSQWMHQSIKYRPQDFKRRILKTNIQHRPDMYIEEQRYLNMIKTTEIKPTNPKPRYYNLCLSSKDMWHKYPDKIKTIGQKISDAKKGKSTKKAKNRKFTDEHKEKLRQAKLGKKLTPEHRAKVIKTLKYCKGLTL